MRSMLKQQSQEPRLKNNSSFIPVSAKRKRCFDKVADMLKNISKRILCILIKTDGYEKKEINLGNLLHISM